MKLLFVMRPTTTGFSMEQIYSKLCEHLIERGVSASIYKLQSTSHFPFRDIIKLNKIDADVFHITGDINYLSTFLPWKNTINTIHDIGRYSELSGLKKFIYKLYWITFPVFTSKFIAVPSNQTKVKLLELFPSKNHKIIIIPHFINFFSCHLVVFIGRVCTPFLTFQYVGNNLVGIKLFKMMMKSKDM